MWLSCASLLAAPANSGIPYWMDAFFPCITSYGRLPFRTLKAREAKDKIKDGLMLGPPPGQCQPFSSVAPETCSLRPSFSPLSSFDAHPVI